MAIAEALKNTSTLQETGLFENSVGVDGATTTAEALGNCSKLQELWLSSNNIGVDGAMAIAEALKTNSTLHKLDLSDNDIGDNGARDIVMALKVNSTLHTIYLHKTNISKLMNSHIQSLISDTTRNEHPLEPALPFEHKSCSICQNPTTLGLSCSDHFICAQHLASHWGIAVGADSLQCMIKGCSNCYQEVDVQNCLPPALYKQYVVHNVSNTKIHEKFDRLEGKMDVAIEGMRYLQTNSDRALLALAHLATGELTPCPKLVWIVPQERMVHSGTTAMMKDLFKDAFYQETAVYFFCEEYLLERP